MGYRNLHLTYLLTQAVELPGLGAREHETKRK